jgi:hypothetical protein
MQINRRVWQSTFPPLLVISFLFLILVVGIVIKYHEAKVFPPIWLVSSILFGLALGGPILLVLGLRQIVTSKDSLVTVTGMLYVFLGITYILLVLSIMS